MLLSIVTGTYNRLPYLKNMMQSVRNQIPAAIDYEFVIVDGGSIDGTLRWLEKEPNVILIKHGELRGAIKAFCDGAKAAGGEYVIMANDDVEFHPGSILPAIAYLEDNPQCGAVAFADNRGRSAYHVQQHFCRDAQGRDSYCIYAQVGMFRRELGNKAGWWGADDSLMSQARTYAGDNFLTSRIWEMGYTIDAVEECVIDDKLPMDALRKINDKPGEQDSKLYYTRYAGGAKFGEFPYPIQAPDRLRILYIPVYEQRHPSQHEQKRGLRHALQEIALVAEYDFVERMIQGKNAADETVELVRQFKPDVVISQILANEHFTSEWVQRIRSEQPDVLLINWHGDQWPEVHIQQQTIQLMQAYDLALVVNAAMIPVWKSFGIRAAYWQVASEEPTELAEMPSHDVVFLANCYSEKRIALGKVLNNVPHDVAVYGASWGALSRGNTLYDFSKSHALMRNAKICLGDNQYPEAYGFVSNRLFETLYAGGFLLHQTINGVKELTGITPGKHYATFEGLADLPEKIEYWLAHDEEREKIRKAGQRYVKKYHTFRNRVQELFTEIIPQELGEKIHEPV